MLRRSCVCSSSVVLKHQVAIVGAGPSALYVAQQLLKKHSTLHVDIYERLPVPFGLSRYGVAPDHPEVKNVEKTFMAQVLNRTDRVSLLCNVNVGKDVSIHQLCAAYSAVVLATGAAGERTLGIPGESGIAAGVVTSRRFVEWYNTMPHPHGSPLSCPLEYLPQQQPQQSGKAAAAVASSASVEHVVLVGNGNVALDIARVLAAPYKHFCPTDMNCFAVRDLMRSGVRRVTVVARRGVEHAAFTIKEFRELTNLAPPPPPPPPPSLGDDDASSAAEARKKWAQEQRDSVRVLVEPFDLDAALRRAEADPTVNKQGLRRKLELVHKFAVAGFDDPALRDFLGRTITFRFGLTPKQILAAAAAPRKGSNSNNGGAESRVGAMVFDDRQQQRSVVIPCDAVITCAGYLGERFPGVPFDEARRVIPTDDDGRVVAPAGAAGAADADARCWRHVYAVGWARNGPRGVILNSLSDAQRVASTIVADLDRFDAAQAAKQKSKQQAAPNASDITVEELGAPVDADQATAAANDGGAESSSSSSETATRDDDYFARRRRSFRGTGCLHLYDESGGACAPRGKYDLVDDLVARRVLPLGLTAVRRIWRVEVERGVDLGKSLEKINNVGDMLNIAGGGRLARKTEDRVRGKYIGGRPQGLELMDEYLDPHTMLVDMSSEQPTAMNVFDLAVEGESSSSASSPASASKGPNISELEPHHMSSASARK